MNTIRKDQIEVIDTNIYNPYFGKLEGIYRYSTMIMILRYKRYPKEIVCEWPAPLRLSY